MLSDLISKRRRELGMSVIELARATNLSRAYIHSLESSNPGKRERQPTAGVLVDLARVLNLSITEVFRAAGIEVADLPVLVDAQVSRLVELAQTDNNLARLIGVWTTLTTDDRAVLSQAAEDLAKLRNYLVQIQHTDAHSD